MPMYNFKCKECDFLDEFCEGTNVPKNLKPPEVCPKCKKGKLERQFSPQGISFDVIGGFDYTYGKKNWKKKLTVEEQSKVLSGDKDPY